MKKMVGAVASRNETTRQIVAYENGDRGGICLHAHPEMTRGET
jgi:hypothetical protein